MPGAAATICILHHAYLRDIGCLMHKGAGDRFAVDRQVASQVAQCLPLSDHVHERGFASTRRTQQCLNEYRHNGTHGLGKLHEQGDYKHKIDALCIRGASAGESGC